MYWNNYVQELIIENKPMSLVTILKDRALVLENTTIKIELDNSLQIDELTEAREELLQYLRKKLRNGKIMISPTVSAKAKTIRPFTNAERLTYLAEKYPLLNKLKQQLGLENDF